MILSAMVSAPTRLFVGAIDQSNRSDEHRQAALESPLFVRLLVLCVRLENELADAVLRGGIRDRPKQCKAPALTVDSVLPRGERDVSAGAGSAFKSCRDRSDKKFVTSAVSRCRMLLSLGVKNGNSGCL